MMLLLVTVMATMEIRDLSVGAGGAEDPRPRCTAKRSQATHTRAPQQLCSRSREMAVASRC